MRKKGFSLTETIVTILVLGCIVGMAISLFALNGVKVNSIEAKQTKLSAALKAATMSILSDETLTANKACNVENMRDLYAAKIANATVLDEGIIVNGTQMPAIQVEDYGVLAFESSTTCEADWHASGGAIYNTGITGGAIYNTDAPVIIYSTMDDNATSITVPDNVTANSIRPLTSDYSADTLAFSLNDKGIENIYSSSSQNDTIAQLPALVSAAPSYTPQNNTEADVCFNKENYTYVSACTDASGNHVNLPFYMKINESTCIPAYCKGNGILNGELITTGMINNVCGDEKGNAGQCACPKGKSFWAAQYIISSDIQGICVSACSELGMIESTIQAGNCVCPPNTEWDNERKTCRDPQSCDFDYLKYDETTDQCICKSEAELLAMDSNYFTTCEIYDYTKINDGCKRLRENWEMPSGICVCPVPFTQNGKNCTCNNPRTLTNGVCTCDINKVQLAPNEIFVNDDYNPNCKIACDKAAGYIPNSAKTECVKCPDGYEPNQTGDACILICNDAQIGSVTVTRTLSGNSCICKDWSEFTPQERNILLYELNSRNAIYDRYTSTCMLQCLSGGKSYICPTSQGYSTVVCGDDCKGATDWDCSTSSCQCVSEDKAGTIDPSEFRLNFGEKNAWDKGYLYEYTSFCKTCVEPRIYDGVTHPTSALDNIGCTCPAIGSVKMQQWLTGNYVYDNSKENCISICPQNTYAQLPLHDVCLPCDSVVADVVNTGNVYSCQCNRAKTELYIQQSGMNAIFVNDITVGCIQDCPAGLVARNGVCSCPLTNTTLINGVCQCRPDNAYYKAEVDAIKATLNPANKEYYDASATANNCISICNNVYHTYNYANKTCDCTAPRTGLSCTCPVITSPDMQEWLTGNYVYNITAENCRSLCPNGTYAKLPLHDICLACDSTVADVVAHDNVYTCECNRSKTESYIAQHGLNAIFVSDIAAGCMQYCPSGLVARNGVCVCPLSNTTLINGVCQCRPDNAYYKPEVDAIKAALNPANKEYYDENAIANNCISICNMENYQYNSSDKTCNCASPRLEPGCVCPSGSELYSSGLLADNQYRNPDLLHCVSNCKIGQKHNKVTTIGYDGKTHAPYETCLCEYPFVQSAAGGDSCECEYPWTLSASGTTCECKSPFVITNVNGVNRCDCPSPRYRSGHSCVCPEQENMTIPSGYIYRVDEPSCLKQCDITKHNIPNIGKNQCICDPDYSAYFYDTADNCGCPQGTTRTEVELLSFNQADFERNVHVCQCQKQCGPDDVPMMVNGVCQCVFDPLIVDYDKDTAVESKLDCGVDITGNGNIRLCASEGDKMLAFNELNSGKDIDATKIFSTETVDPFNNEEKFGSANGFEALYDLAMSAMLYADDNDINIQIITEDGFVELPALKYVLNHAGWDLGFISDDNISNLDDLGHVVAISTDYYSQNDAGTPLEQREAGFYKSIDGTLQKVADVWVKLFSFIQSII